MTQQDWGKLFEDNPEDRTLRLAFADWLEEHGEAGRAEGVRWYVETGRKPYRSSQPGLWVWWDQGQFVTLTPDNAPTGVFRKLEAYRTRESSASSRYYEGRATAESALVDAYARWKQSGEPLDGPVPSSHPLTSP